MDTILLILAITTLIIYVFNTIDALIGNRSVKLLSGIKADRSEDFPSVSVIIPARNEEKKIEEALISILNLEYPGKEVIVVNDRSTDNTGVILEKINREFPELKLIHINELPDGWLGKNHALQLGAGSATGDFFLFTDADVAMQKDVLKKAVVYMQNSNIDHLTITPHVIMPGHLMNMFVAAFSVYLSFFTRPWKVKDQNNSYSIGIGAFNLIRKAAYSRIGEHNKISLRPDDDIKLGALVKKNGLKQDVLFGKEMIIIEWYSSFKEIAEGLTKNMFAGFNYNVFFVLLLSVMILLFAVWPAAALLFTSGVTLYINLLLILNVLIVYIEMQRVSNAQWWYFVSFPFASVLFVFIIWKSMFTTLLNNGINWRGTHYPLELLKKQR